MALLHKALHRRTRVVLWSMDCYPDAAERFGELRPGGAGEPRCCGAVNRWVFRRLDHVVVARRGHGATCSRRSTPPAPTGRRRTVIPNWERAEAFPADATLPAVGRVGRRARPSGRTVVLYLGNIGRRAPVRHRASTPPTRLARRGRCSSSSAAAPDGTTLAGRRRPSAASRNVVLRGYVPKDDTPRGDGRRRAALITLDERSLGVMSPSKLHANLAAGLPVLYVGPAGSNVDEAIARYGCGTSLREGDVDGLVPPCGPCRGPRHRARRAPCPGQDAFDAAYSRHRHAPPLRRRPRRLSALQPEALARKYGDGALEALAEVDGGLPAEQLAGLGDVGLALRGVVDRQRLEHDLAR